MWDQYDEFGDTNLLLVKPEEGASLARALGQAPIVLMKGHGATVVGSSMQDLVFRAIYSCRNAEFQYMAKMLGNVSPLRPGEIEKSAQINAMPTSSFRTWEYWSVRLEKAGGGLPKSGKSSGKKPVGARAKRASVAARAKTKKARGRKK
jgi:hypothetical protein